MTRRKRALLQGVLLSASVAGGLPLAAGPAAADHYRGCDDVVVVREYYPRAYLVPVPVRVYYPYDDGYVRIRRYHDRYYDAPTIYFQNSHHHHHHWDD